MLDLQSLRTDHLRINHDLTLYPYQEQISNRIINALVQNLEITKDATPEQIEGLRLTEIPIEISRQAGKTTAVVHTVELIMTFLASHFDIPIHVGIFAPQIEQAKTDFEKLKNALRPIKGLMIQDEETLLSVKERENAKTLVLPNGSSCWIAPVTTTSKPESKTFHLMIFEEAQDVEDRILKERIWPIGATTNAPRVYIGTAGTQICHFYRLGQTPKALKIYFDEIVRQRRVTYEQTGDARHLIYEQTVKQEMELAGEDSDEIQRPYFGKWLIGEGNFVTAEELESLVSDRGITQHEKVNPAFAGIDTAKHPDSTVVTILRHREGRKEVLNWLELQGDNYMSQAEIIYDFLKRYKIYGVAIDSTGQGDFMSDWFENNTEWTDENTGLYRIKFSAANKHNMYTNLKASIKKSLTDLPRLDTKNGVRFKQQMLDLQQQYKGQFLAVSHPDSAKAHDDYCDSLALAEWAFAKYNEINAADLKIVDIYEQKKDIKRDSKGKIQEYWPGLDW